MSKFFIMLVTTLILLSCKTRGDFASFNESQPTWDDMRDHVQKLKPYDLSILFPPAGVPRAQTENSQALPFLKALFDLKSISEARVVPKTRYTELHQKTVPIWGSSQSEDRLESWFELGFWPLLFSDTSKQEPSSILGLEDAEQVFPLVFPKGNPNKATAQGSPWIIPAWQWTKEAPRPLYSGPREGEVPVGRGVPDGFKEVSVNVSETPRWRIVSMRLDLCPNSYQHFWKNQRWTFDTTQVNKWCHPEIRFVAQPMLGYNAIESAIGRELPDVSIQTRIARAGEDGFKNFSSIEKDPSHSGGYFADYAMHLFHKIDLETAKQMLAHIAELKLKHEGLCDTNLAGLRIHPCLIRSYLSAGNADEILKSLEHKQIFRDGVALTAQFANEIRERHAQWSQINFASEIFQIFRQFAGRPEKIAFFASTASQDPWIFHLLELKQGHWQRASIPAFKRNPIVNASESNLGKSDLVTELQNDSIQIIPRGARLTIDQDFARENQGVRTAVDQNVTMKKQIMYPLETPARDSLEIFLRGPSLIQQPGGYSAIMRANSQTPPIGLSNIDVTGDRAKDLHQVVTRINNPAINTEFSTGCGSCHLATPEKRAQKLQTDFIFDLTLIHKYSPRLDIIDWSPIKAEILTASSRSEIKHLNRFRFESPLPQSPGVSDLYQTFNHANRTDLSFVFNQFSIYRESPVISDRVANESELSLATAFILAGKNLDHSGQLQCENQLLRLCIASYQAGLSLGVQRFDGGNWLYADAIEERCLAPEAGICRLNVDSF